MWKNMLHPSINKSKWTREEDEMLKELVGIQETHDWDMIAEELDTGRTPFLCFHRWSQSQIFSRRNDKKITKILVLLCYLWLLFWSSFCLDSWFSVGHKKSFFVLFYQFKQNIKWTLRCYFNNLSYTGFKNKWLTVKLPWTYYIYGF